MGGTSWRKPFQQARSGRSSRSIPAPPLNLLQIADAHGKTPAQVALRFLMQSGVAVIPKSVHDERIEENLGSAGFDLTADEMERLAAMDEAKPLIGKPEDPALVEFAMTW